MCRSHFVLVLLAACAAVDNANDGRRSFTCYESFHCGPDAPVHSGFLDHVCLVGHDDDDQEQLEAQNPEWFATFNARCAAALPSCDFPQCFINCRVEARPCLEERSR